MRFYDREEEIEAIHEWNRLSSKRMQVGVIYGRRRTGKTRLIREALTGRASLYFFVARKPVSDLLQDFQEELDAKTDVILAGRIGSISEFLSVLSRVGKKEPLTVVFDEFQNFRYIDPSVFGTFQRWIDEHQEGSGLTVIFIGSMFSLMKKIFLEYKEPLYGRLTGQILLRPLSPMVEAHILKDLGLYSPSNWLRFHALFGGIPRYYDLLSDRADAIADPLHAIRELIVGPFAVLKDEGRALLMEEFGKKYMVYFSVLQAISRGQTTRSQISNASGLRYNRLGPYLDELEKHYELIERETPILALKEKSKNSRYRLKDPFIRFWFRYLIKYGRFLELEAYDMLMEIIQKDLSVLEGLVFEELVKKTLILLNRRCKWEFSFDEIGRYWERKGNEIDLVAVNRKEKKFLFAECKLSGKKVTGGIWSGLRAKSESLLRKYEDFKPCYGAFVVRDEASADSRMHPVWSLQGLLDADES